MDFREFLTLKLKERKIDVSVYLSYLITILEENIDDEEKRESVSDIIGSLIVNAFWNFSLSDVNNKLLNLQEGDTASLVDEIFNKWNESHAAPKKQSVEKQAEEVDIAELLKTQTNLSIQASGTRNRQNLTEEQKRIKEQILASYSQTDDPEEDDDESNGTEEDDDPNFEKNTNKSDVQKLAREKREQAKQDSEQKKLKDKEDRAKQKASREDKKKNRQSAAVKGERRRWWVLANLKLRIQINWNKIAKSKWMLIAFNCEKVSSWLRCNLLMNF